MLSGTAALHGGGDRRGAAVRHLDVADVEVVVREDRAADGADQNGAVLDAELVDGLGQQLVDDAVAAAGAVVRLVLQFAPCARSDRRSTSAFSWVTVKLAMDQHLLATARTCVRRNASTSSAEGALPPTRLKNSTGRAAFERQPHVVQHLAGAHLHHHEGAGAAARARESAPTGNGYRVMGRSSPTLMPRARACSTTAFRMRPTMP